MQRLIIVYNPRSSKQVKIQTEVIDVARSLSGYQVGKFEVKKAPVEENAKNLARILMDGDLIISAGGDGTATVGINAALLTEAKVTLGILGYGNFNDAARMLGEKDCKQIVSDYEKGSIQKLYPLEAWVDDNFFRYAACYFSIGMFAESTEEFNAKDTRTSLKKGKKGLCYSIKRLAAWYFKNKKRDFLPVGMKVDGKETKNLSDVLFVNSKSVAKIMKGGDFWQTADTFLLAQGKLRNFFRLVVFMAKSFFRRIPGTEKQKSAKVEFLEKSTFEIQAEGEYKKIEAEKIEVRKSKKFIRVVTK